MSLASYLHAMAQYDDNVEKNVRCVWGSHIIGSKWKSVATAFYLTRVSRHPQKMKRLSKMRFLQHSLLLHTSVAHADWICVFLIAAVMVAKLLFKVWVSKISIAATKMATSESHCCLSTNTRIMCTHAHTADQKE